ncbi:hypothetical protein O181_027587 [Austropuccinia psidii MF-1]|uniref:Uncharacterized protein n=1 Tax=Austropuccinia psidii MF-1 TaxID=1389203 RepID=A0A9Q3H1U3_9BASI|nr:hypothetical protein [Austropuccinia psidii MF-1]
MTVYHLNENLLAIHPTTKDFPGMWKREYDTDAIFTAGRKEYNKQEYDKIHKEPIFREEDQVLVSTLNLNNLKGSKRMRD